jgi:predicted ATPase
VIDEFSVSGFKCFESQTVSLHQLTVLCGINGAGKSSFIQALLLAHLSRVSGTFVPLNGPLGLRLGQAVDVLRSSNIELMARCGEQQYSWRLSSDTEEALVLHVDKAPPSRPNQLDDSLIYLEAERLGPRDLLSVDSTPGDTAHLGSKGEYVAQVLDMRGGRLPVRPELCHSTSDVQTLPKQVEAWLGDLVPGIELRVESFPSLNASSVRLRRSDQKTDWLRPQNIGFGLSYVLPVLVAGLVARPGGLILVENPEAHLHPQGQSMLARFLSRTAASGVQVVVETHSDHFLNGLRLACVDDDPITADQVGIQYFSCPSSNIRIERIEIDNRGGLTAAPSGFFDQSEKDLAAILRARRRGRKT